MKKRARTPAERAKKFRLNHPDRVKEIMKKYWASHPEVARAQKARYYLKHRDEVIKRVALYQSKHPEKIKQYKDKYTSTHTYGYPEEFFMIKYQAKARDKNRCMDCGEKNRSKLVVHHLDGNKYNNNLDNLLTLCRKCHGFRHRINLLNNHWNYGRMDFSVITNL